LPYIGCLSSSQGQGLQGVEERNGNMTNFACNLHLALDAPIVGARDTLRECSDKALVNIKEELISFYFSIVSLWFLKISII
jgi:hypothetical protein